MGGKKYNKDGTKKPAAHAAPPSAGQQPSNEPSTSAAGIVHPVSQQQSTSAIEERDRTHGPTFQHRTREQPSQPIETPHDLPRAESVQSVCSSTSSARGGAIPKASVSRKVSTQVARRPLTFPIKEPGTLGEKLGEIETNYLKIDISKFLKSINIYKYDVEIETKGPRKLYLAAFLKFREQFLPNQPGIAYDWKKIAVANFELDHELTGDVEVRHPQTCKIWDYKVTLKPAKQGALVPIKESLTNYNRGNIEETMQVFDIIFKSAYNQHLDRGIRGGRSFFPAPERGASLPDLRDFAELRKGLFQSVTIARDGKSLRPLLNVDVSNKAFPKPYNSLIDLLRDMNDEYSTRNRRYEVDLMRPLNQDAAEKLHAHLSGLELCYCSDGTNKRIYRYFQLGKIPAEETIEIERDGRKMTTTVKKYFDNDLRRTIRFPNLQCIRLGNKKTFISVPMEYCAILEQIVNKKCTDRQTAEMIRHTAVSTDQRKANIEKQVNSIQYNNRSATLAAFGITVDDKNFMKVPARQLHPPEIVYKNGKVTPDRGQWRMEFRRQPLQFLQPADCLKWSVLITDKYSDESKVLSFVTELYRSSQSSGPRMEQRPLNIVSAKPHEINRQLHQMAGKEVDIIFCIIPSQGSNYTTIKQAAELESGVLTQCITSDTIFRRGTDRMTLSNILLKVNAKLNGTNHQLSPRSAPILNDFDKVPVMFIGADVTHPTPGQMNAPSVAAVVSSYDRNAFCYNSGWRPQVGEIIADFQVFVREALLDFRKVNGKLPLKIFYFRDGVSDSQFKEVMEKEYEAMYQACRDIKEGYEKTVKMTIIIVQKRHHTRFFPGKTGISNDKNNNVPPGTVVDTVITRPDEAQFYLTSHQAIQGVSRPTKYCILLDNGNHTMDDLQALTYALCHMFARCNRSVSYPAPTYYAHLAAARGKVLITGMEIDPNNLDRYRQPEEKLRATHPMRFI